MILRNTSPGSLAQALGATRPEELAAITAWRDLIIAETDAERPLEIMYLKPPHEQRLIAVVRTGILAVAAKRKGHLAFFFVVGSWEGGMVLPQDCAAQADLTKLEIKEVHITHDTDELSSWLARSLDDAWHVARAMTEADVTATNYNF